MSHFLYSLSQALGEFIRHNPRKWIYGCVFLGFAIGISLFGGLGVWLGGLFGQATNGAYVGLSFYSAWAIFAMDATRANAEQQIELIEKLAADLGK